jgi:hypothetical protein
MVAPARTCSPLNSPQAPGIISVVGKQWDRQSVARYRF